MYKGFPWRKYIFGCCLWIAMLSQPVHYISQYLPCWVSLTSRVLWIVWYFSFLYDFRSTPWSVQFQWPLPKTLKLHSNKSPGNIKNIEHYYDWTLIFSIDLIDKTSIFQCIISGTRMLNKWIKYFELTFNWICSTLTDSSVNSNDLNITFNRSSFDWLHSFCWIACVIVRRIKLFFNFSKSSKMVW